MLQAQRLCAAAEQVADRVLACEQRERGQVQSKHSRHRDCVPRLNRWRIASSPARQQHSLGVSSP